MSVFRIALALLCLSCSTLTYAAADRSVKVKEALVKFLKRDVVTSVKALPVGGLYEAVLTDGQVIYTDAAVSYISIGEVVTTKDRRNLTEETKVRLAKIDFATLPLAQAIKQVKGDGSRVIAVFEDPNCPYCKKIQPELAKLDNVTIYTFMSAVLGEDSIDKAKKIWCADDRAAAWNQWMAEGVVPDSKECEDVVDANLKLAGQVRLNGTPTIFFEDGSRVAGYVTVDKIEAALALAKSTKK